MPEHTVSRKPRISPPRPDLIRTPTSGFGWLDDRLLNEGWLQRLGPEPTAVLVLLALAADRQGASFYGRERMAVRLAIDRDTVDRALQRLLELGLVAHKPWRPGHLDGIWQLLPVPHLPASHSTTAENPLRQPVALGDMLQHFGFNAQNTPQPKPPESRAS